LAERFLMFYLHATRARIYEAQVVKLRVPMQGEQSFGRYPGAASRQDAHV
jgi:hypothetical protein